VGKVLNADDGVFSQIENVTEFVYLGSLLTWDNDCSKEVRKGIVRATVAQTLSIIAQDHSEWRRVVMEALDTNGRKPME